MIKKIFFTIILSITLVSNSYSAGSSGGEGDGPKTKTNYEKAVKLIKSANKYEKKEKKIKHDQVMKKL